MNQWPATMHNTYVHTEVWVHHLYLFCRSGYKELGWSSMSSPRWAFNSLACTTSSSCLDSSDCKYLNVGRLDASGFLYKREQVYVITLCACQAQRNMVHTNTLSSVHIQFSDSPEGKADENQSQQAQYTSKRNDKNSCFVIPIIIHVQI